MQNFLFFLTACINISICRITMSKLILPRHLGFALILITVGLFLLLEQFGYGSFDTFARIFWPLIIIYIGISHFLQRGSIIFSSAMFLLGSLFLVENLGFFTISSVRLFWPILIIGFGLWVLIAPSIIPKRPIMLQKEHISEDDIAIDVVFGGVEKTYHSKNLKGGYISASFGGADVNLNPCEIKGEIVLEIRAVFGGVQLWVPSDWTVINEVQPLFGGVSDERKHATPKSDKILRIVGEAVFGGIEIKS